MEKQGVLLVETHRGSYHAHIYARVIMSLGYRLYFHNPNDARWTAIFAKNTGATAVNYLREALGLSQIVGVVLCVPPQLHRIYAELCFAAGKHVLVEKPITITVADAQAMMHAAACAGVTFGCAEEFAARAAVREARDIVLELGDIATIRAEGGGIVPAGFFESNGYNAKTGVLLDLGVHHIRVLRMLFGEIIQVIAGELSIVDGIEKHAEARMLHETGQVSELMVTWMANLGDAPQLVVRGTNGTIHVHRHSFWPAGRLDYFPAAPSSTTRAIGNIRPWWLQESALRIRDWNRRTRQSWEWEIDSFRAAVAGFFAAVEQGRSPEGPASADEALADLKVVRMICEWINTRSSGVSL